MRIEHLPTFGKGAFRGSIAPSPAMPPRRDEASTSSPFTKHSPTKGYHPVYVSDTSAGNRVRLGVLAPLLEWAQYIGRMSGQVFRRQDRTSNVTRGMLPARRFTKLPANRRVVYEADSYGSESPGASTDGLAARGLVAQRDRLGGKLRAGRRWDR
jgi:hypothetical protein